MSKYHPLWGLAMSAVTHRPEFSTVRRGLQSIGSAVWRSIATAGAAAGVKSYRGQRQRVVDHAEQMIPFTDEIEREIERRMFNPGRRIRYWL
jgi:hypothetical protein